MDNINISPLVSVIIPTYKRPGKLGRAIESVLNQTYNNLEIIIVDDNNEGSVYREQTEKFMERYKKESKIIYLKHQQNKNASAARNTGLKRSKGKYIAFLDDDDEFLPTKLEKQIDELSKQKDDWGGCYCHYTYYYHKKLIKKVKKSDEGDLSYKLLSKKNPIAAGSTLLIRREAFEKTGFFDESFERHQDWEYMLRFFRNYKLKVVDKNLVNIHISKKNKNVMAEKILKSKKMLFMKFKDIINNLSVKKQKDVYYQQYIELANLLLQGSEYKLGLKFYKKANKYKRVSIKNKILFLINFLDSKLDIKLQIKRFLNKVGN